MHRSIKYYNRLSLLAVLVLVGLVSLQVLWVVNAVKFKQREVTLRLKEVVGDLGLEVNRLDHNAFHAELERLDTMSIALISQQIEGFLSQKDIAGETYFAIYQDTTEGVFLSNRPALKDELLESEVRTCLSCIVSFWTYSSAEDYDTNSISREKLNESSTFQYYSPVSGLDSASGKTLWLSLYQPGTLTTAIQSMVYLFVLNVVLLLVMLALIRHLIRSLSRHKLSSQVKTDFFNNMTHEFKTPISSIRLASRVLRAEPDLEKRRTYYDLIERESKSLEQQIDKLLELSLLENDEIKLDQEPVDLCALVHEIPSRLRVLLDKKSGNLHLDCQLSEVSIVGDQYHLLNSLVNLVENSLKYSPVEVNIWIHLQKVNDKIVISVKDDGPGIREEDRTEIFSRFYRGQANGLHKGAGFGIGLSYVKSIIEAHQGTIQLNLQYKAGTEFVIQL